MSDRGGVRGSDDDGDDEKCSFCPRPADMDVHTSDGRMCDKCFVDSLREDARLDAVVRAEIARRMCTLEKK